MCYEVRCSACGKTTWAGCGRHVQSVYKRIQESQRCLCKEWPGISSSANSNHANANSDKSANPRASQSSSVCNIL